MKEGEIKPSKVYRIYNRENGEPCGAYSRACFDEMEFSSAEQARNSHCWNIYKDKKKYRIAKYKITYTLIEEDVP